MYAGNESAIYQHGASCGMQRSHDLVAVGITIAAVTHHELMIWVECAARLDPLPLISVGDRRVKTSSYGRSGFCSLAIVVALRSVR